MNNDLYFDGKRFISSSRAAKISGYVNDYIGQLCRDGKLECRMVGRSWYVSLDSLIQHKNLNGSGTRSKGSRKLKHIAVSEPINLAPEISGLGVGAPDLPIVFEEKKVGSLISYPFGTEIQVFKKERVFPKTERRPISLIGTSVRLTVGTLAILFALMGFSFGLSLTPNSMETYSLLWQKSENTLQANVFASAWNVLENGALSFYETVHNILFKTRQRVFVLVDQNEKKTTTQATTQTTTQTTPAPGPKEGLVVVPVKEDTDKEAVVKKIKNTFSDEVRVSPDDSESGVITPVFKETKDDEYLYVLVPIGN